MLLFRFFGKHTTATSIKNKPKQASCRLWMLQMALATTPPPGSHTTPHSWYNHFLPFISSSDVLWTCIMFKISALSTQNKHQTIEQKQTFNSTLTIHQLQQINIYSFRVQCKLMRRTKYYYLLCCTFHHEKHFHFLLGAQLRTKRCFTMSVYLVSKLQDTNNYKHKNKYVCPNRNNSWYQSMHYIWPTQISTHSLQVTTRTNNYSALKSPQRSTTQSIL
jgi:hypothetical protein